MRSGLVLVASLVAALLLPTACGDDAGGTAGGGASGVGGSVSGGSSSGGAKSGGSGGGPAGGSGGAGASSGGSAGSSDSGADAPDSAPEDPCPTLAIPPTCFGREVMYREWGATATGDGSYFADQAPYRLGFNRIQGRIWIVKVKLEENSYRGRLSAYGDSDAGIAWISDKPCDATFAEAGSLIAWGMHGGGSIDFVVTKDAAHAQKLKTDPTYASYAKDPQLRGGHCYYLAFENTDYNLPAQFGASYIATSKDECGASGNGTCYYLAMDFGHLLHDITSGQTVAGNVIPGLSQ